MLTELLPYDDARRAHLRVRQFFNAQALADRSIAERTHRSYARFHDELADLVARSTPSPADDAVLIALKLAALTEGLAYYVLIGACTAQAARDQVLAELAATLG